MDKLYELKTIINDSINQNEFIKAILSKPAGSGIKPSATNSESQEDVIKIEVRLVDQKAKKVAQFSSFKKDGKVIHKNAETYEIPDYIISFMQEGRFLQCNIINTKYSFQAMVSKKGSVTVVKKLNKTELEAVTTHNNIKKYIIPEGQPVRFLTELGIMDELGNVKANRRNKFTQINRYAEMLADVVGILPEDRPVRVLDFGCGKSYLTFVLYHYFTVILKRQVQIKGLDLKKDVVEECEALARKLDYTGLSFEVGDIAGYITEGSVDMVVSLHACDTATDAALERAVKAGAKIILAVPCCQHELAKQLSCENLKLLTSHGILHQRISEIATDALRAAILEICGYKVQVMEFVETEHTPKNLMIRAVKRNNDSPGALARRGKLIQEYYETCRFLSVDPAFGRMLKDELKIKLRD